MRGPQQLRRVGRASGLLVLALISGCGRNDCCGPNGLLSIQLAPTNNGDGQTDTIGGALANPLRVLVLRGQSPVSGIEVSWTTPAGSISPTSMTTDASGIARASLTLGDSAGTQSATASIPSDTAVGDTLPLHVAFSATVRPGSPAALVYRPGPSNAFAGRPLIPAIGVAAVDRRSNVATDFHGTVTVALGSDPSGASLTGTTMVDAVEGVATFADLSLGSAGVGFTLTASASGLAGITSAAFEIVTPGPGRIAFSGGTFSGGPGIYTMSADGSGLVNLTNNSGDGSPVWSPDGTRIAFSSSRDGDVEIYVMSADGSGLVNLTKKAGSDYRPVWAPDGTRIAFVSVRDGNNEIYVMNADGSGSVNLTNNPASDIEPAWSPDGSKIAFESFRDGNSEIYVMNADGSTPVNLTNDPGGDNSPAWSPAGSRIAFWSEDIYLISDNGSGVTRITTTGGEFPVWSPDGARIVYTSVVGACGRRCRPHDYIHVVNADGSGGSQLTNSGADNEPAWSPDGTRIAFRGHCSGKAGICVINADGTGLINLVDAPAAISPAWQPR